MSLLKDKFRDVNVILASGSHRRKELLKGLDIPFVIKLKEVNEVYPSDLEEAAITEYLAELKASVFTDIKDDELLITADTIVWLGGKALMKPIDAQDAKKLLQTISGKVHKVFTSVCLKSKAKTRVFSDVTNVFFKELSDDEIDYYVDNYKPFDKAGAYGAQDWIGYIAIEKLEGSYFNVMGLPVHKLYKELLNF
jgi:septum formation protein